MITFLDGTGSLQEQHEPQQEGQRGVGSVHGGGVTCAGVSLPGYCGPLSSLPSTAPCSPPHNPTLSGVLSHMKWGHGTNIHFIIVKKLKSVYQYLRKLFEPTFIYLLPLFLSSSRPWPC